MATMLSQKLVEAQEANDTVILIFNKTLQNPFSPGDALNDGFGKIMNDITKTINHVGKSIKDFIFEPTFSEFLPNLLNGIHFRGVRWYME